MKKTSSKESKPAPAKAVPAATPVAAKRVPASKAEKPEIKEAKPKAKSSKPETPAKPKAPAVKSSEPKPVVSKAPAVKVPSAQVLPSTVLIANIDVGFGNSLYVRGEGAGLSWDKGLLMENLSASEWKVTLPGASTPVAFKFLINDCNWSLGDDYVAVPGSTSSLVPLFEV